MVTLTPRGAAPTEAVEQAALARRLNAAGLVWFHVPNGGSRGSAREGASLRAAGLKAGVPDVVILSPAPGAPRGAVIELKRRPPAGRLEDVRPEQWAWLGRFAEAGFAAMVALGCEDAVSQLRGLGYPV